MSEARTRPAREGQRFQLIVRAEMWFWKRMCDADDPCWDVLSDWNELTASTKIRRFNNANPQECQEEDVPA